jgi:signal transduction histidine kinase
VENLVRNAEESLPAGGGRVTVTLAPEHDAELGEDRVVLQVADTGAGIAAADRERIFDDFYTTKPGGTGLGLSSVRRLVGDCGGRLGVDSEPGRGSVFTVSFPLPDPAGERP